MLFTNCDSRWDTNTFIKLNKNKTKNKKGIYLTSYISQNCDDQEIGDGLTHSSKNKNKKCDEMGEERIDSFF